MGCGDKPPIEEPWGYSGKFKDLDGHVWEILWDPKFKEYVRHDFGAVRPYLYGHLDLPEFVKHTFGAVELERIGDDRVPASSQRSAIQWW